MHSQHVLVQRLLSHEHVLELCTHARADFAVKVRLLEMLRRLLVVLVIHVLQLL